MAKKPPSKKVPKPAPKKRTQLRQTDVPSMSLDQALRVPQAIEDEYAGKSATPLQLAVALELTPSTGGFRMLCGASIAYGLTAGGYNAKAIVTEPLGKRITAPTEEGDDKAAKREAVLKPKISGDFLRQYAGKRIPRKSIALNVLAEMGVPKDKTETAYKVTMENARSVGLIRKIREHEYAELDGVPVAETNTTEPPEDEDTIGFQESDEDTHSEPPKAEEPKSEITDERLRRVFITHGKNKTFLDLIQKLLGYGELKPVISVDKQTVSKPVPEKVMDDMRSCGAAIIHVEAEKTLVDENENEHTSINENVLIEIGAAMALYGKRFILLVGDNVKLPSNLQGLFEVRYTGTNLDGDTTMKLLDAIKDIKSQPLPPK